jgi:TonB family protein
MRTGGFLAPFILLGCWLVFAGLTQGQQSTNENGRKIVRRLEPQYPEMAKRMNLAGTVKVFVVVGLDGTVKSVEPIGGSPLLVQASTDALTQWRFAPANVESKELIELHFHP